MSTESQISANRLNAQKSTGPRTAQGKAKVSQNAVTHGLTSKRPVLDIEDTQEFRQFTTELIDCLVPADPLEFFFAQRAACLAWRLQRAQSYETLILNNLISDCHSREACPVGMGGGNPDLLSTVLLDDFRNHRTLEKISRYEARLESSMLKSLKQFENLRKNRKTNPMQERDGASRPISYAADMASVKTNPNMNPCGWPDVTIAQNKANLPPDVVMQIMTKTDQNCQTFKKAM